MFHDLWVLIFLVCFCQTIDVSDWSCLSKRKAVHHISDTPQQSPPKEKTSPKNLGIWVPLVIAMPEIHSCEIPRSQSIPAGISPGDATCVHVLHVGWILFENLLCHGILQNHRRSPTPAVHSIQWLVFTKNWDVFRFSSVMKGPTDNASEMPRSGGKWERSSYIPTHVTFLNSFIHCYINMSLLDEFAVCQVSQLSFDDKIPPLKHATKVSTVLGLSPLPWGSSKRLDVSTPLISPLHPTRWLVMPWLPTTTNNFNGSNRISWSYPTVCRLNLLVTAKCHKYVWCWPQMRPLA